VEGKQKSFATGKGTNQNCCWRDGGEGDIGKKKKKEKKGDNLG